MNNKGRRTELKMLKYKRRLKKYGFSKVAEGEFMQKGVRGIFKEKSLFAYKSHGKPCSCWACKGQKYNRAKVNHTNLLQTLNDLK